MPWREPRHVVARCLIAHVLLCRDNQVVVAPPTVRLALPGSELIAVPNGQEIVTQGAAASVIGAPIGIFTCQTAIWGQLGVNWHAGSLRVGSLWLVAGTQQGYVRVGRPKPARGAAPGHTASSRNVDMLLHLDAGSTVVMRVAAGSQRYFRFLDDARAPLAGDQALIFTSCPGSDSEDSGGFTDFFEVPFSIAPGYTAPVEVWTSASTQPVWLTFSAPRSGR